MIPETAGGKPTASTRTTTQKIAELVGRGVTLTVDLVEAARERRIEVVGPKYRASFPECGCDQPVCAGPGTWGQHCKEGYDHGRQYCHGNRASGWHAEHVEVFAAAILKSFGRKVTHKPKVPPHQEHRDINRGVNQFTQLDGEEEVRIVKGHQKGTPSYKAPNQWSVFCDAPRCLYPINEFPYRKPVAVITADRQESALYERECEEAEQRAYDIRNEHIAWHRAFGISDRVLLDRWIAANAMVSAPEPDRAELDCQLAIAKADR
jgi:hypothetical protein